MKLSVILAISALFLVVFLRSSEGGQTCECSTAKEAVSTAFIDYHIKFKKRQRRPKRRVGKLRKRRGGKLRKRRGGRLRNRSGGHRIVGGYDAMKPRPWIAKLQIVSYLCGGSLLNKRYVLSAAHCFCKAGGAKGFACSEGKPLYDVRSTVTVYLGLNQMKIPNNMNELAGSVHAYGVESVKAHAEYEKNYLRFDIAIIRLDRDAEFKKDFIMPICLPIADDNSDIPQSKGDKKSLHVAGWGKTESDCTTNEKGPVRGVKCQLPFKYGGAWHNTCSMTITPSANNEECKKMRRKLRSQYPKQPGEYLILNTGSKNVSCYAFQRGKHGWCTTVRDGTIVDDQNWGWCRPGCSSGGDIMLASTLKETNLEILNQNICKELAEKGGYKYFGGKEICAGKKKHFKKTKIYKEQNGKYEVINEVTNYMGLNDDGQYPYDFFVSGTDSCQGDSGGPAYMWVDGKPILYGVVSRGSGSGGKDGCAEFNFPGIYTRTTKFLDWINSNIADGNC